MNASFESLFIFLLSKLRLPQVYCEPVDGDKSYIARSITLVRHKKRGTALCRLRAASNFQCVGILPYRSLPTKKNPPHPKIALTFVVHAQHRPAATFNDCQEWVRECERKTANPNRGREAARCHGRAAGGTTRAGERDRDTCRDMCRYVRYRSRREFCCLHIVGRRIGG